MAAVRTVRGIASDKKPNTLAQLTVGLNRPSINSEYLLTDQQFVVSLSLDAKEGPLIFLISAIQLLSSWAG